MFGILLSVEGGGSPPIAWSRLQCRRAGREDIHGRWLRVDLRREPSWSLPTRQSAGAVDGGADKVFTFDEIVDAHRYPGSNAQFGKSVATFLVQGTYSP
jgi:hypothetical protein